MRYGKISNGELIYAPTNYEIEDGSIILNFNKDEKALKKYGYKQVVEALRPPYPYIITYKETATKITEIVERDIKKEEENKKMMFLTGTDVERAILAVKGMDFDDVIEMVETMQFAEETQAQKIDLKALKIELKANHFYRGNPYVNAIGNLLGFTTEQLDKFFETNDYKELIS